MTHPLDRSGWIIPSVASGMVIVNVMWAATSCWPINWWRVPNMAWLFLFVPGHMLSCLSRTFGAGIGLIDQAQHIQKNYNGGSHE